MKLKTEQVRIQGKKCPDRVLIPNYSPHTHQKGQGTTGREEHQELRTTSIIRYFKKEFILDKILVYLEKMTL